MPTSTIIQIPGKQETIVTPTLSLVVWETVANREQNTMHITLKERDQELNWMDGSRSVYFTQGLDVNPSIYLGLSDDQIMAQLVRDGLVPGAIIAQINPPGNAGK